MRGGAPTSIVINGVIYNPYKWPYKWVNLVITLLVGAITPFITGSPPCMTLYLSTKGDSPRSRFFKALPKNTGDGNTYLEHYQKMVCIIAIFWLFFSGKCWES